LFLFLENMVMEILVGNFDFHQFKKQPKKEKLHFIEIRQINHPPK